MPIVAVVMVQELLWREGSITVVALDSASPLEYHHLANIGTIVGYKELRFLNILNQYQRGLNTFERPCAVNIGSYSTSK